MSKHETLFLLESVFGEGNIVAEWDIGKESEDALQRNVQYCPRIDYAVKPLNIDREIIRNSQAINERFAYFRRLIDTLKEEGLTCSEWTTNENPRCFLAIEYENKTSTKHRLGSLINAGAIGKVGIIVTLNPKTYRSYERILNYLEFLQQNKKLNLRLSNIIILERDKFEHMLLRYVDTLH